MGFLVGTFVAISLFVGLVLLVMFVVSPLESGKGGVMSYESGFKAFSSLCSLLAIRYFLLVLVFLVLDLELGVFILIPMHFSGMSSSVVFGVILSVWVYLLGTVYEWWLGSLSWCGS